MPFFKITENSNNYLTSLAKIFKDDKYFNRLSHILFIYVNLYVDSLNEEKNKKFSSFYYNECLELIRSFRVQINVSYLKTKLYKIEKKCLIERDKIIVENHLNIRITNKMLNK